MVVDFRSTWTDKVTKTIDISREERTLFQFQKDTRLLWRAENMLSMVDVFAQRLRGK